MTLKPILNLAISYSVPWYSQTNVGLPKTFLSQLFPCLTALAKTFKVTLSHHVPHISFSYLILIAKTFENTINNDFSHPVL